MKTIKTEEFLVLLSNKEALQKDISLLSNVLMQASLQITGNNVANTLNQLNALLEEITEIMLTYVNLSDKVVKENKVSSITFNNLTPIKRENNNECN